MKKTYISPNMLVVRLGITRPLATSTPGVGIDNVSSPVLGNTLDVKESSVNDVNVWDNEW